MKKKRRKKKLWEICRREEKNYIEDYIKILLSPSRHSLCLQTEYELSPILLNRMKRMTCSA